MLGKSKSRRPVWTAPHDWCKRARIWTRNRRPRDPNRTYAFPQPTEGAGAVRRAAPGRTSKPDIGTPGSGTPCALPDKGLVRTPLSACPPGSPNDTRVMAGSALPGTVHSCGSRTVHSPRAGHTRRHRPPMRYPPAGPTRTPRTLDRSRRPCTRTGRTAPPCWPENSAPHTEPRSCPARPWGRTRVARRAQSPPPAPAPARPPQTLCRRRCKTGSSGIRRLDTRPQRMQGGTMRRTPPPPYPPRCPSRTPCRRTRSPCTCTARSAPGRERRRRSFRIWGCQSRAASQRSTSPLPSPPAAPPVPPPCRTRTACICTCRNASPWPGRYRTVRRPRGPSHPSGRSSGSPCRPRGRNGSPCRSSSRSGTTQSRRYTRVGIPPRGCRPRGARRSCKRSSRDTCT
eukprot:scaffold29539_cov107-Isochrysis_galbana.AAC.1